MERTDFEHVGRFIYGGQRHGADEAALLNWMADDLQRPRVSPQASQAAKHALFDLFFARLVREEDFQANYARFIASLARPA